MVESRHAPKWHFVWSDGYATQFKSSKPWYFVTKYLALSKGCNMIWCCFGRGHGKGPCDGAGVVVKKFICQEQLNTHGGKLTNATKVSHYLKSNLSSF